ncbi:MAG: hypothetical protein ACE37F_30195 [Nannocystaceae bacterium]|nr:hypothetical protein [bacterium]
MGFDGEDALQRTGRRADVSPALRSRHEILDFAERVRMHALGREEKLLSPIALPVEVAVLRGDGLPRIVDPRNELAENAREALTDADIIGRPRDGLRGRGNRAECGERGQSKLTDEDRGREEQGAGALARRIAPLRSRRSEPAGIVELLQVVDAKLRVSANDEHERMRSGLDGLLRASERKETCRVAPHDGRRQQHRRRFQGGGDATRQVFSSFLVEDLVCLSGGDHDRETLDASPLEFFENLRDDGRCEGGHSVFRVDPFHVGDRSDQHRIAGYVAKTFMLLHTRDSCANRGSGRRGREPNRCTGSGRDDVNGRSRHRSRT